MSLNHKCHTQNSIQANCVAKFIGNRFSAIGDALGVSSIIQHHRKSFRRKSSVTHLHDTFSSIYSSMYFGL